MRFLGLFS